MTLVTAERIALLAPRVDRVSAQSLAVALNVAMPAFKVSNALRLAHFMGQTCFESVGFTRLEENLNYLSADRISKVWPRLAGRAQSLVGNKQALANAAYAGRNGNGDEASGDGWRFRGMGLIQLTGRTNYTLMGKMLAEDLVGNPSSLVQMDIAARASLCFWSANGCNAAADLDDCEAVTRIINGPRMDGLEDRRSLTERAKAIFT